LAVSVAAAMLVVGPVAAYMGGVEALRAAAVAALVCLAGSELGLAASLPFRNPQTLWLGVLLGMLPRLGIPLGFAAFFSFQGGRLANAGFLYYLLVFYLVSLAVETAVMVLRASVNPSSSRMP